MDKNQLNNMWPNRDALIVCEDTNYLNIFRQILRPFQWAVLASVSDAQSTREQILSKAFGAIIVVESRKLIASELLRSIFQIDRTRMTPVLVITNFTDSMDLQIFQKIYSVAICTKPLIPAKFASAFQELLGHWQQPAMFAMRQLAALPIDESTSDVKLAILERLINDSHASNYALQASILIHAGKKQYREAEKKILEYFRASPGNASILAVCAWFYLDAKSPHYALKFLNKLKQLAPSSVVLNLDIACAHIASGHLDLALDALKQWNSVFPGNSTIESFIARLVIAEGRHQTFELTGVPNAIFKRTNEAWLQFESNVKGNKVKSTGGIKAS